MKDEEVVMNYTKMNHLELRVKNIAVTKLINGQQRKDWRLGIAKVCISIAKDKDMLKR